MGIIPLLSEWGANQSAISELILSCCITVIHQMEYDDNWVWINKISLQIFKNIVTGSCYKKKHAGEPWAVTWSNNKDFYSFISLKLNLCYI